MTTETPELIPARDLVSVQRGADPARFIEYAMDKGADLDRLEKLFELKERWEAAEAKKAFVAAMAAFHGEPVVIGKNKRVSFKTRDGDAVEYSHAELSDVTAAIGPAMAKHGLSYRWHVQQGNGGVTVRCVVEHARGHSESVELFAAPDASGKKNAIQQTGSAITYLQRYTLLAISGQSTTGSDDDGHDTGTVESDEERAAREKAGSVLVDFLSKLEEATDEATLRAVKKEASDHYGAAPGSMPPDFVRRYNALLRKHRGQGEAEPAAS